MDFHAQVLYTHTHRDIVQAVEDVSKGRIDAGESLTQLKTLKAQDRKQQVGIFFTWSYVPPRGANVGLDSYGRELLL